MRDGRATSTLAYLQSEIQAINGVSAPPVEQFLIGREAALAAGGRSGTAPPAGRSRR